MKTEDNKRFIEAINKIDDANSQDPRTDLIDGKAQPRELVFSKRVYEWVKKLLDNPSEELLLAARAHTLRRWSIPRDKYPKTTVGYHQWRSALAQFHADQAEEILRSVQYPDDAIQKVRALVTKDNWPGDPEACALEDADCLVFLEIKLTNYLDEWDEEKTIHILKRSIQKMTPKAREHALGLKLGERERQLLEKASH